MWSSEGSGSYTIAPATREQPGTDIVLHMKADADEFLDPWKLNAAIRKWADHITIPITVARDGKDEPANEGTALLAQPRGPRSPRIEYAEFYRHLGHSWDKPWATLHWRAEGTMEYTALLFVPGSKPFQAVDNDRDSHVRLHVRRMFITDKANLLPTWLRFIQGVVDTEDLPLNVSREMLQATPVLARIRKAVTNRVLTELKTRAKEAETYQPFWENFGAILKEGIWEDGEHRTELAPLLRFASSTQEGLTTFADYVSRMKPEQETIWYLAGDSIEGLKSSPQLEGFAARGVEVLLLDDHVDAFWPERMDKFETKNIRSITQDTAELAKIAPETAQVGEAADLTKLIEVLKTALGDEISDARGTDRLTDSAVVLAGSGAGPDLQLQRLLKRSGQNMPSAAPVLELNARHELVRNLAARAENSEDLSEVAYILLDLARVQDGEAPKHPGAFAKRVTAALTKQG